MSTEAQQWAIEEARAPAHLFAVLVCLAWKAGEEGRGAYPSVPTMAAWTGKSDRKVRADLRELEDLALIRPGDQSLARGIRADRRPAVYDLAMPAPSGVTTGSARPVASFPPEVHDLSSASPRDVDDRKPASVRDPARPEAGDRPEADDRSSASANRVYKKPSKPSSSRKRDEYDDARFAEFWSAYPRRTGKRAAWLAWQSALRRGADPAAIVKAALAFAEQRAGKDPKFTPHPATWLNGERYDDEEPPALPEDREYEWWR